MIMIRSILLFTLTLLVQLGSAQVSITGSTFQPFEVTPASICQSLLLSTNSGAVVTLEARLYNSAGEQLMVSRTAPITLRSGMNTIQPGMITLTLSTTSAGAQGEYIRNQRQLPGGLFRHCITLLSAAGEPLDEFCQELEGSPTNFLQLVAPGDQDTVDQMRPTFFWTHSEPFNLLTAGETFRLTVVLLEKGQTAEQALAQNLPVLIMHQVLRHDVPFPSDAPALKEGQRYAWQVQRIAAGGQGVVAQSEVWQFVVRAQLLPVVTKYAIVRPQVDAGYYTAANHIIYFRFQEEYTGGTITCKVVDASQNEMKPVVSNDNKKVSDAEGITYKSNGDNRFELDLQALQLKAGFYTLEVVNAKKEKFYLKFYVD